jgi:hypothetical protein
LNYFRTDAWVSDPCIQPSAARPSRSLSDMVAKFILEIEESCGLKRLNFVFRNTEELFCAGPIAFDVRRMYSYPATVQAGPTNPSVSLVLLLCIRVCKPTATGGYRKPWHLSTKID